MMETQHTPGPWKSIIGNEGHRHSGGLKDWSVIDNDGYLVAQTNGSSETEAANARLIAASPVMHKGIEEAIADIDDWLDPDGEFSVTESGLRAMRKDLKAAIKATVAILSAIID